MVDYMKTATYLVNEDTQIKSDYSTGHMDWLTIYDSGTSSAYPFGQVSFNSQNLSQLTKSQQFLPQEGYLYIPITYKMSIGNTAGDVQFAYEADKVVPSNVCALAKKSGLCFIERTQESVAGINLGYGANQRHLHQLLKAHEITDDQLKFDYENLLDHYFPDRDIRKYSAEEGEKDNLGHNLADQFIFENLRNNKMFFEQARKFVSYEAHNEGTTDNNPFSQLNTVSNGVTQNTVKQLVPHFVNGLTELCWYDILQLPLRDATTAFGRLPSCSNLNGLQLTFSLPALANGVSMSVTYTKYSTANLTQQQGKKWIPKTVTYNAGTSSCFPFLLAEAWNDQGVPFTLYQKTGNVDPVVNISGSIGWGNKLNGPNCFIRMPIVDLASHIDSIARNPKAKIDALDAVIDTNTFTKVAGGTSFQQRTIAMPHSKLRRVWLIPQLHGESNGSVTKLDAPMSPFSMSPVWPSNLSLDNINVFVGGEALYGQPITMKSQLYEIFHKQCCNQVNGNSMGSLFRSGQLKYCDWLKTPIYMFNILDKYTDEENDTLPKQISFSFNCDWKTSVYANIAIVFEKEVGFAFDRISGLVTNA